MNVFPQAPTARHLGMSVGLKYVLVAILCACLYGFDDVEADLPVSTMAAQTSRQLVSALADSRLTTIVLYNDTILDESDFLGHGKMRIERNVSIIGVNNYVSGGAKNIVLDLNLLKQKVQIAPGITLTIRNVVLINFRERTVSAGPGLDVLAPTPLPDGSPPALLIIQDCFTVIPLCYPHNTQRASLAAFVRPASLPGTQRVFTVRNQSGCCNSSAVPMPVRCWTSSGIYVDLALAGADMNSNSITTKTNYNIWLRNVDFGCEAIMDEDCVARYTPVGCLMFSIQNALTPPPLPPLELENLPACARAFLGAPTPPDTARVPALLPGCLAGALVLLLLTGAVVILWMRRWRRGGLRCGDMPLSIAAAAGDPMALSPPTAKLELHLHPSSQFEDSEQLASHSNGPSAEGPGDERSWGTGHATARHDGEGPRRMLRYLPATAVQVLAPYAAAHCPLALHVVVTPFTPRRADLALGVVCGSEVTLLPVVRGKGNFGRVHEGLYGGQRVAVKLLPWDALTSSGGCGDGGCGGGGGGRGVTPAVGGDKNDAGIAVQDANEVAADDRAGIGGSGGGAVADCPGGNVAGAGACGAGACGAGAGAGYELATFAQEVEVLGRCDHPNVVRLLAACLGPPQPCLVMELAETSLDRLLHEPPAKLLPLKTVLQIAVDIARGLEYLHPTIVHRDLKPPNVLVNMSGEVPVAKLSDFGLSRLRTTVVVTRHPEAGTPAYMAPECFDTRNLKITHQADMYSFAVILWEMLTGLLPWWGYSPMAVAYTVTLLGERLPLNCIPEERCPAQLRRLMEQCFDAEPRRRLAAAEVVKELKMVLNDVEKKAAAGDYSGGGGGGGQVGASDGPQLVVTKTGELQLVSICGQAGDTLTVISDASQQAADSSVSTAPQQTNELQWAAPAEG